MRLIDIEPFETEKGVTHCQITRWRNGDGCADMVVTTTKDVPTADVAPVVHGEWEHLESGWHDLWRCTSCGDEWTFEYDPTDKETMVNFCPNCGADMRERKGDDG